jgi:protein arginine N-methyltransferase 1
MAMKLFKKIILFFLNFIRKILSKNQKLRIFLYNIRNKEEFENLYEHEKMLADTLRTNTYKTAIKKLIKPEDRVLELGTGTGILTFFTVMQKPKKLCAIDHSDFINIAREISRKNKIENVEFVQANSRNYNPKIKFDVIIHEQIGDYLFNENMIQNIIDLKKRLLTNEGRIIPGEFELFLEPTSLNESYRVPFIWENESYDIDFKFLKDFNKELGNYKPAIYPQRWIEPGSVKQFLCDSNPVLMFDLNKLSSEKDIPDTVTVSKTITSPGIFDGFCLYFKVIFDDEINFDTSPMSSGSSFRSWGNCFFRAENRRCVGGETIKFEFKMQDLLDIKTWSVVIKSFVDNDGNPI